MSDEHVVYVGPLQERLGVGPWLTEPTPHRDWVAKSLGVGHFLDKGVPLNQIVVAKGLSS